MSHSHAQVVFYSLSRKFVQEKKAPPKAQEVIYYSLAIGHHLGVIDCLEAKLSCPLAGFRAWVQQLPAASTARRKLEGVDRFGEICIDSSHTHLLATALSAAAPQMDPQQQDWSQQLIALLQSIENEPAIYLMVRRHDD
ncbi:formate hydrogenlyase maturation HycH family protein [Serratia sp. NFX21]|uniref:formate hydrogenlyase maturation HycH family protein n=1 Tax=Serratia sp. NFX21 TaxID=3402279 RepID=UPI003AF34673